MHKRTATWGLQDRQTRGDKRMLEDLEGLKMALGRGGERKEGQGRTAICSILRVMFSSKG